MSVVQAQTNMRPGELCAHGVIQFMKNLGTKKIIARMASWPEEDQEELAEIAREIEARRSGVYTATAGELRALDEAERSGIASQEEVEAAFRSFRRR